MSDRKMSWELKLLQKVYQHRDQCMNIMIWVELLFRFESHLRPRMNSLIFLRISQVFLRIIA